MVACSSTLAKAIAFVIPFTTAFLNLTSEKGSVPTTVCKGAPYELYQVILEQKADDPSWINILWKTLIVTRLSLLVLEVGLNIKLFKNFSEQTNKMKTSLSKRAVKKRNRKNAISLQGHLIGFAVHFSLNIVTIIFVVFNYKLKLDGYILYSLVITTMAISNLSTLLASPELRREYLGDDDVLIPKKRSMELRRQATTTDEQLEMALNKLT